MPRAIWKEVAWLNNVEKTIIVMSPPQHLVLRRHGGVVEPEGFLFAWRNLLNLFKSPGSLSLDPHGLLLHVEE